jgi:hypothetical protein
LRQVTFLIILAALLPVKFAFAQVGYGGPTISGVPSVNAGARAGRPDGISYFAGVTGNWDDGITPVSVDSSGNLVQTGALWGASVNWGLFGQHRGRHYLLGVDYAGAYHHYSQNTYFNGLDSVLALDIKSELSKRTLWYASTQAGSVASAYGGWTAYAGFLPGVARPGVPVNDIYDNRNYFLVHNEEITYLVSPRLSVTAGGNANIIRRQSNALVGVEGYGAFGSLTYRLSRLSSVSLNYGWTHYDYTHHFGEATISEALAGYARQLSRRWTTELMGGAYRVDTAGLISLPADPAIIALFGQNTVTERYYARVYYPAFSAGFKGAYRRYRVSFGYARRPSPGNGVYLTSRSEGASAAVSYTGLRDWNLGASLYFSKLTSVAQKIGSYGTVSAGVGGSHRMYRYLNATFRADWRTWQVDQSTGTYRPAFRVQVGVAWSPSDLPLSLW